MSEQQFLKLTTEWDVLEQQRAWMVQTQLEHWGINDRRVLQVMGALRASGLSRPASARQLIMTVRCRLAMSKRSRSPTSLPT